MMNFRKLLKNIWVLFLTPIAVLILIPIFLIIVLPLRIHRSFVWASAKLFKSHKLCKMLNCTGSVFASEDVHGPNAWTSGVTFGLPIPHPNLEELRKLVVKNGTGAKNEDGSLKYPELSQEQRKWMGHLFWAEPEKKFDIKEHVYNIEDVTIPMPKYNDRSSFQIFLAELIRKKWVKGRPLWDFIVIPNIPQNILDPMNLHSGLFKDEVGSAILFRMHHSLGDGIAGFKLISNILDHGKQISGTMRKSNIFWKAVASVVELWKMIKTPFIFVNTLLTVKYRNIAKIPLLGDTKISYKQDLGLVGASSNDIPLKKIKEVKNQHKVDFVTVLLAMAAVGIRNMILAHGGKLEKDAEINIQFTMPMPGHPDKLRNHITGSRLRLPIGIIDPINRLQKIQNRVLKLRNSDLPYATFLFGKILGSLPHEIKKGIRENVQKNGNISSNVLSNMVGQQEPIFINGAQVMSVDVGSNSPVGMGHTYGFFFSTYNDCGKFVVGASKKVLGDMDEAERLLGFCLEELELLWRYEFV